MSSYRDRIILALDMPDLSDARKVLRDLKGHLRIVKLGSACFYKWGNAILNEIKDNGYEVFVDFKFHDIPNTVASAVESILEWNIQMFTVHLSGGLSMLKAVTERLELWASRLERQKPLSLGISILTSMDEHALNHELKIQLTLQNFMENLVQLALLSGLGGVVSSGHEIRLIRSIAGDRLKIVCPGIRSSSDTQADQKRTLTAPEAFSLGADYIVVGRPLYAAASPRDAFLKMADEVSHGAG